jgi:AcrR family transcriptional regulator
VSSASPAETPARGTRPRNRRAITLDVATDLFARYGYARVSMVDIAAATNVGPSALYRHFPGKADLLVAAIHEGLAMYAAALTVAEETDGDPSDRLTAALRELTTSSIEHRPLGLLWQRDARNLPADEQRRIREELRATVHRLARLVRATRPELDAAQADALAWCTMGALVSLGFHALELPRPAFDDLMLDVLSAVNAAPMPEPGIGDAAAPERIPPATRREALISAATTLIADRGFAATGIDDIGDAAGIAGPSVYTHFANKQAILAAAIQRASAMLLDDLAAALASSDPAEVRLSRLITSYVRRANADRSVIRALVSDMDQLLPEDQEVARLDQRRYIDAWVSLLREIHDIEPVPARIRVQAVLLAVNDAVQTPHLRALPGFERLLVLVTEQVLGIGAARRT